MPFHVKPRRHVFAGFFAALSLAIAWTPAFAQEDFLFWTESWTYVRRSSLVEPSSETIVSTPRPRGIAVDDASERIFWTDTTLDAIWAADLNGSNPSELYAIGVDSYGLAIDERDQVLYWTEPDNDRIGFAPLDGSGPIQFVDAPGAVYMAFDPVDRVIFYQSGRPEDPSRWRRDGSTSRLALDGSEPTWIPGMGGEYLALDPVRRRLYTLDNDQGDLNWAAIHQFDLQTSTVSTLYSPDTVLHLRGLAVDSNGDLIFGWTVNVDTNYSLHKYRVANGTTSFVSNASVVPCGFAIGEVGFRVTSPNEYSRVESTRYMNVAWKGPGLPDDTGTAQVFLSTDGGSTWMQLTEEFPDTGSKQVLAPCMNTTSAILKVVLRRADGTTRTSVESVPFPVYTGQQVICDTFQETLPFDTPIAPGLGAYVEPPDPDDFEVRVDTFVGTREFGVPFDGRGLKVLETNAGQAPPAALLYDLTESGVTDIGDVFTIEYEFRIGPALTMGSPDPISQTLGTKACQFYIGPDCGLSTFSSVGLVWGADHNVRVQAWPVSQSYCDANPGECPVVLPGWEEDRMYLVQWQVNANRTFEIFIDAIRVHQGTFNGASQLTDYTQFALRHGDHSSNLKNARYSYLRSVSLEVGTNAPAARVPSGRILRQNVPNPFNPRTSIRFDLPRPELVRISIYDLRGRQVRTLLQSEPMPSGSHEVSWDGTGDDGRAVASGTYVVRLVTPTVDEARQMILLK